MRKILFYITAVCMISGAAVSFSLAQTTAGTGNSDGSSTEILIFKVDQEKRFKENIENLLAKKLGSGKAIVTVSVEMTTEIEKNKKETYTKPADDDTDSWLTPGIPMPPGLKGGPKNVETFESVVKPKIVSVAVSLIVDESIVKDKDIEKDPELAKSLTELVENTVGLPKAAQRIVIKSMKFSGSSSEFMEKNKTYLIILLVVAAIIIFFFGPVRSLMKGFLRTMQEGKGREISIDMGGGGAGAGAMGALTGGGAAPAMVAGGAMSAPQIAEGGSKVIESGGSSITLEKNGEVRVFKPFSFIKKSNIQNLVYLIQEEPPEIVSLIMTYLSQDEAAEVMTALPVELQAKVAVAMAQVKQASAESVLKAEEEIKRKIDFLVGGVERFIGIMDKLDRSTRDEILDSLEKESPVLAERIRKEIFTFENLVDLEDAALQLVLREIKTDVLAKALTKAQDDIAEKVKKNISSGASTLLQEEMNLVGYLTPMQIDEERAKIVNTIKRLEKEGKIAIGKKRKRAEKIEKIQKLQTTTMEEAEESKQQAERPMSGSGEQKENFAEKKVSIRDYEGRSSGKILSMVNIFKQMESKKPDLPSNAATGEKPVPVPEKKTVEKEVLYTSKKNEEPKPTKEDMTKHYNLGVAAYKEKKFDDAVKEFNKCIEINPNLWQIYQFIGNCYYAKGNIVETVRAYQKSLSINPNNPALASWIKDYYAKNKTASAT